MMMKRMIRFQKAPAMFAAVIAAVMFTGVAYGECGPACAKTAAKTAACSACDSKEKSDCAVQKPSKIALVFHADWCGSCKALDPKIKSAHKELEGSDVLFVKLDLTDDATRQQAALLAGALGLGEVYSAQEGKTGIMLVIDGKSGEVVETVTRNHSPAEIVALLK